MPRVVNCTVCALSMQPFFARGVKDVLVELDRCPSCTRLWFDVKELETAAAKTFLPRMRGADSTHLCPLCAAPLSTSLIRGDVPIEECATCSGALLDAHDFELISGGALVEVKPPAPPAAPAAKKAPPAKVVEFTCAKCHKRFPLKEADNVNGATVCRQCATEPWPDQPKWSGNRSSTALGDVEDWLDLLGDLFTRR